MRLRLVHALPASPERLWRALEDPDFQALSQSTARVARAVVEEGVKDGLPWRLARMTARDPLPPPARAAMGVERLTWDQEETVDAARFTVRWRVSAAAISDRFRGEGTWTLRPAPHGTDRVIEGDVSVAIPLIGGKIESAIARRLTESYDHNAAQISAWLREHP